MERFINKNTGVTVMQENRTPEDLAAQGFTPVSPTTDTKVVVPPVSGDITPVVPPVVSEPTVVNKQQLLSNVQSTLDKYGGTAGANEAFIQGVAKLATGKSATAEDISKGGTIADVIGRYKVGEQLKGFGVTPTVIAETPETITETPAPEPKKSIIDQIREIRTGKTTVTTRAADEAGVKDSADRLRNANLKVQEIKNKIQEQTDINQDLLEDLEGQGRGITSGLIASQQANMTVEQQRALRDIKQDYNNALLEQIIEQGAYDKAEQLSKDIAADLKQDITDEIDLLLLDKTINEAEAAMLKEDATTEFNRQSLGYTPITKEQASLISSDKVIRVGDKVYLKPAEKTAQELEIEGLDLLSKKLGIEKQLLENQLIGDDKFQSTVTTTDGIFRVTYDKNGNEVNRARIGDAPENFKAPSATQSQANTFANRVQQAEAVINELAGVGSGYGQALGLGNLPELFKTENRKRFEQAEKNFINSVLRRESGAAIAETEFANARQQYLPQPGDGEKALAQKAANRKIILDGLKLEAGGASVNSGILGDGGVSNTEDLFN